MGDKTKIEWTDATPMVDRNGRRVRFYHRKDTSRPGQQIRRKMAAVGLRWCRGCHDWLDAQKVDGRGTCRIHTNEEYREMYRAGGKRMIAARVHARKRNVAPMDPRHAEILMDWSGGKCVYCGLPATTFDHVVPVSKGGQTKIGNMVPACGSCNSAKRAKDLDAFLVKRVKFSDFLIDMIVMSEVA